MGSLLLSWGLLFAAALQATAGTWTNYRHDAAHTANTRENLDPRTLVPQWSRVVGAVHGAPSFRPLIWNQRVFIYSVSPHGWFLEALHLSTGELLWRQSVVENPQGPIVAAGRLLVSGARPVPHIDAYEALTGEFLWTSDPAGDQPSLNSPPVARGNLVYQAVGGGHINALDITSGSAVWQYAVRGGTHGTPAITPEGQLFATYPAQYYALDARTGDLLWHVSRGSSGGGGTTPTVGDLVYMVDRDWDAPGYVPTIYALTKTTGEVVWKQSFPLSLVSDMALDRDGLYVTIRPNGASGTMRVLDPGTGRMLWEFVADTSLFHAPVIVGRHVFVGSFSKTYAVRIPTAEVVWTTDVGGQVVIAHRSVLISTDEGVVHAYVARPWRHR